MTSETERLAQFADAVRDSTLKRLRHVPEGFENWKPATGSLSIAQIAMHLVAVDRWLFHKVTDKRLEPIAAADVEYAIGSRRQYLSLLEDLRACGTQRSRLIRELSEDQLAQELPDTRFGEVATLWWIIVRGNLDHEIHHRGQLASYLTLIEHETERTH